MSSAHQPTSQTDDFGTPTNSADDEKITFTYTPTGLEASKTIAKADGAGGWINEQQVTETYYANGLLKTLTTTDGGSPATTLSQHTLSYITAAGIYMDGNRVSDVFQLKGPDASAPCYSTTCTASWQYDARDRLTEEVNGTGTTVDYTLDVYGNSTQEKTNGTVTRTAIYSGLQLTSDTVSGVTHKYLYDSAGNLNCVVTSAWNGSGCPALYYGVAPDPSLVTYNLFDSKNRLVGTWTFNAGTQTDGAVYTLDSLDRVLSESEWHSGVSSRTDFTYIGLSDAVGQEQHYDGSGVLTETKSYVYDALGRPATLTDTPAGGATSRFSYVFDPHGSVELVLDQNRQVEAAYGYNAYGDTNLSLTKTAAGFSPNTNAFQFQSERYDTGSKTIDFGARHYNPALERFTQRDSYQAALDNLGLSTDPLNGNRYALTAANPINFVDLDGHRASFGGLTSSQCPGMLYIQLKKGQQAPCTWGAPPMVAQTTFRITRPTSFFVAVAVVPVVTPGGLTLGFGLFGRGGKKKNEDEETTVAKATPPPPFGGGNGSKKPQKPSEPYSRSKYGSTPTASDRKALGAGKDQAVNHDPPLVKRYYEGDPATNEKPGHVMTSDERKASATDRSRMNLQSKADSNRQGGQMSAYSKQMKQRHGL